MRKESRRWEECIAYDTGAGGGAGSRLIQKYNRLGDKQRRGITEAGEATSSWILCLRRWGGQWVTQRVTGTI